MTVAINILTTLINNKISLMPEAKDVPKNLADELLDLLGDAEQQQVNKYSSIPSDAVKLTQFSPIFQAQKESSRLASEDNVGQLDSGYNGSNDISNIINSLTPHK